MNPGWINGVTYTRLVRLNLLRSDGKTATAIDSAAANMSVTRRIHNNQPGYLETAYDLLAGSYLRICAI